MDHPAPKGCPRFTTPSVKLAEAAHIAEWQEERNLGTKRTNWHSSLPRTLAPKLKSLYPTILGNYILE